MAQKKAGSIHRINQIVGEELMDRAQLTLNNYEWNLNI